jgi:hypothetical protein
MYLQTPQMNRFCLNTLVTKSLRDGTNPCIGVLWFGFAPPNNQMQRAGKDKVPSSCAGVRAAQLDR